MADKCVAAAVAMIAVSANPARTSATMAGRMARLRWRRWAPTRPCRAWWVRMTPPGRLPRPAAARARRCQPSWRF